VGGTNRRAEQARLKAIGRNKALWDHYNTRGVLLLADFKRITGGQFRSVLATFDTYGLKSPPVYDSRQEKYERQAKRLRDGAAELGQSYLTISQAAKILNTKPGRIIGLEGKLLRTGCELPDIVMDRAKAELSHRESAGKINGDCNPLYYPAGLQVARYWPGPGERRPDKPFYLNIRKGKHYD
jgi:hypothetical protein